MNKAPTTLIIMDGFGLRKEAQGNAVAAAATPVLDRLFAENAWTELQASGRWVGLPDGQMGNSEVGHTNIGGSPTPRRMAASSGMPPTSMPWRPAAPKARPCT